MKKTGIVLLLLIAACGCNGPSEKGVVVQPEVTPAPTAEAVAAVVETEQSQDAQSEFAVLKNDGTWNVAASSSEKEFTAEQAVDGSADTRWASKWTDAEWWMVDFGKEEQVKTISVVWETAFAKVYDVQICGDDEKWDTVLAEKNGHPGGKLIVLPEAAMVRRVRIVCKKRGTQWGNSLLEVLFNDVTPVEAAATASSGGGDYAPAYAIDGDMKTRWSSGFSDDEWWQIKFDNTEEVGGAIIRWQTAFAEKFDVQISDDGETWKTVFKEEEGDGNTDIVFFKPEKANYLRIQGRQRGTGWGYSIHEVELFTGNRNPIVTASTVAEGSAAVNALDGDKATAWGSSKGGAQELTVELPKEMQLGGMEILWNDAYAKNYTIAAMKKDGWKTVFEKKNGNGEVDYDFFPAESTAKVRISMTESGSENGNYSIREMKFKSGEEAATPLRFYKAAAKDAPEGYYPMWLRRIQEFWTIVGVPEDKEELLLGETGTVEPRKNGYCVQPFVTLNGKLTTWADVQTKQKLEDELLPLPTTTWITPAWDMEVASVAYGKPYESVALVRYRIVNKSQEPLKGRLALATRPFQLNPVWQRGGMSSIKKATCNSAVQPETCAIDEHDAIVSLTKPNAMGAAAAVDGDAIEFIVDGKVPDRATAEDADGMVSIGLDYALDVAPGASQDVVVAYPLHWKYEAFPELATQNPTQYFDDTWAAEKKMWDELLNRFSIEVPDQNIVNMMKSYIAYILLNKDGPWIKPGPRNYNHAWVRDGAMTSVSLLRMGIYKPVTEYIKSYSALVNDEGWAPFIILEGGHPVAFNADGHEGQEYDSQGQYPFLIRQYYDFTGDEDLVRTYYPKVVKALQFAKNLRRERMTDEYKNDPEKIPYYGILPESNSHEGYFPAKHSYWDDYWYLRGLKDGIYLSEKLGHPEDTKWLKEEEASFRHDLTQSIMAVIRRDNLQTIPGCVELGDFDPTSTAIAITACEQDDLLPEPYKSNSFNFYFDGFKERLKPDVDHTFTPYEVRTADAFVRMGDAEKALTMLEYFTEDSSLPQGWNHLAEVVHARKRAPSYIGDMPHTWVGSGYIGAVRTIFAYEDNGRLILARGINPAWLNEQVKVTDLPTQYGEVSYTYTFSEDGKTLQFSASGEAVPPNGFVLYVPPALAGDGATVNGQNVEVNNDKIVFSELPAELVITLGNPGSKKKRTMNSTLEIPEKSSWRMSSSADENNRFAAANAADGRKDTRWSSPASDPQWLQVDLGAPVEICGLILHWEAAFSSCYRISVSGDARSWKTVYETESGDGGLDDVNFTPVKARYVRLASLKRGTGWGHSLWELDVKGMDRRFLITADSAEGSLPEDMISGKLDNSWVSAVNTPIEVQIDLREKRAFGGVRVDWGENYPKDITMQVSDDGKTWRTLAHLDEGVGMYDLIMHQREEGQYLKLILDRVQNPEKGVEIKQITLRGPDEVITPLASYELVAQKSPLGYYPEQLKGRQVYWTISGLPGDDKESLFDEYGNLEALQGGPTVMPYIQAEGGELIYAANSTDVTQTMQEGYMPLPSVLWHGKNLDLSIDALSSGKPKDAFSVVNYTLKNVSGTPQKGRLLLTLRPVQINPIWQHGGLSHVSDFSVTKTNGMTELRINGRKAYTIIDEADVVSSTKFVNGDIIKWIARNDYSHQETHDEEGLLSGVVGFDYDLQPGEEKQLILTAPLHDDMTSADAFAGEAVAAPQETWKRYADRMHDFWKKKVERVGFEIGDKRVSDTVKSQIAYILINQDGQAIQPGSRNYNRSWIRDGSITSAAMMRQGLFDEAVDYLNWYSDKVLEDGMVPPILNTDGTVATGWGANIEYDSQGQFIYAIMEYYRYSRDNDFLAKHYDNIKRAMKFMQVLRERTLVDGYMGGEERFKGIFPPSISHEGYHDPAHSYWDVFWALRGWEDGIEAAEIMQDTNTVAWAKGQCDELRASCIASLASTIEHFGIDFIPSSADFGDPDANSIAIAIHPCGQADILPVKELNSTFSQYIQGVFARGKEGASYRYTPYEVRNIMALIELGNKEDAVKLHDILLEDRRPSAWNHFAEVVISEPRIGTYIGDMPHTWVGAGYANSIRSMLVKEDGDDLRLLYATPKKWLEGDGVHLRDLPSYFGPITMDATFEDETMVVNIAEVPKVPGNVVVSWPIRRQPIQVLVDGADYKAFEADGIVVPEGAKEIKAIWGEETERQMNVQSVLDWMKLNQDVSSPEKQLLADELGSNIAQTFNNALCALAFTAQGERGRAERILDYYQHAIDKDNANPVAQNFYLNGEARGFFQNAYLNNEDGMVKAEAAGESDRWMGDMAWLYMACEQYEHRFKSDRFALLKTELSKLLKSWFVDLGEGGGYLAHGWRKRDKYLHEEFGHHEGNIDAYAIMKMMGEDEKAEKIKTWLLAELSGDNRDSLPFDLYTWRVMAFAPEYAEALQVVETEPGFKKTVTVRGQDVVGFTAFRNNDLNIWSDGLGHIACAYASLGDSEQCNYYVEQLEKLMVDDAYMGKTVYGIPYTATRTPGFEWVKVNTGFVSCAAWYLMGAAEFNAMQIKEEQE